MNLRRSPSLVMGGGQDNSLRSIGNPPKTSSDSPLLSPSGAEQTPIMIQKSAPLLNNRNLYEYPSGSVGSLSPLNPGSPTTPGLHLAMGLTPPESGLADTAVFWNVYGNVLLYAFATQLWYPLLPYIVKDVGGSPVELGYLMGLGSFMQMVGAIAGGPFLDRYGAKRSLILAYGLTSIGYGISYYAQTTAALFVSRFFVLFQQAVLASRTHIAVESGSDTKLLSYLNLFYAVGSVLGPMAGSVLVREQKVSQKEVVDPGYSPIRNASLLAAALSVTSMLLVAVFPLGKMTARRLKARQRAFHQKQQSSVHEILTNFSSFRSVIVKILHASPMVGHILAMKMFVSFASNIFHNMLALTMAERFGLLASQNGSVFAFCGVIAVVAQLSYNFAGGSWAAKEERTLLWMTMMMGASYAMSSLADSLFYFCLTLLPMMASATIMHSLTTAMITRAVPPKSNGTIIGVDMAMSSCQRVLAPLLGTWVIHHFGYQAIGWTCALLTITSIGLQVRWMRQNPAYTSKHYDNEINIHNH